MVNIYQDRDPKTKAPSDTSVSAEYYLMGNFYVTANNAIMKYNKAARMTSKNPIDRPRAVQVATPPEAQRKPRMTPRV